MKKIVALFTLIILTAMLIPTSVLAQSDVDVWDGSIDTDWYYDDVSAKTFEIHTAEELAGLAKIVDSYNATFYNDEIILMNNLDLNGIDWNPIGTTNRPFEGTFNGNNYTISNLSINLPDKSYIGLFAKISQGGGVSDLGIINVDITGNQIVGAVTGSITGSSTYINRCYVTGGSVKGNGNYVGGLVGDIMQSNIEHNYSDVDVTGAARVGGLVGQSQDSLIANSFATGNVSGGNYTGGLLGCAYDAIDIEYCYAAGVITSTGAHSGGLFGGRDTTYTTGDVTITSSYGNNEKRSKGRGTNGSEYIIGTEGVALSQGKTLAFKEAMNGGSGNNIPFALDDNFNGGYPYLVTIPQIMTGDNQTIKQGESLVIKTTSPYFASAGLGMITEVDGKAVASEMVSYEDGSTIMTLSGEFTKTLPAGTYPIYIGSDDMGMARGSFTVIEADVVITDGEEEEDEETSPKTGDNSSLNIMFILLAGSLLGLATIKKRNRV